MFLIGGGCNRVTRCISTDYAYIIGTNKEAQTFAAEAMKFSAIRFQAMTGKRPSKGTIVLDRNLSPPFVSRFFSKWLLPYYSSSVASSFESQLSGAVINNNAIARKRTDNTKNASALISHEGVLSHEICHILAQAHAHSRKVPMAFQETIAVGCEGKEMRSDRIKIATRLKFVGLWSNFLNSGHPLDSALAKKYLGEQKNQIGVTNFELPVGTQIEKDVLEYYSRAAIMAEFLEHRCGSGHPIGRLLAVTHKDFDIGSWMVKNQDTCFGPDEVFFSHSVDNYISSLQHGGFGIQ